MPSQPYPRADAPMARASRSLGTPAVLRLQQEQEDRRLGSVRRRILIARIGYSLSV